MLSFKRKIVIAGAGNVGEAIGYTLMLRKQASEIVFVDINEARAQGSALDIKHGTAFLHEDIIRSGGYEECADADIIIIAAGVARKPGQTRLDLARINVGIARDITKSIMKYAKDPMIVVVSNPVDIMTYTITKESGLPSTQVIGTGTSLDTARFRCLIGEKCKVSVNDINAYIIGEHGDSQVSLWSKVNIGGEALDAYLEHNPDVGELDQAAIDREVCTSGANIISKKGATFYGVAMATSKIVDAILEDQRTVIPVSHVLGPEAGELAGVSISLPCVINHTGIVRMLDMRMSEEETQKLHESVKKLRAFINDVFPEA